MFTMASFLALRALLLTASVLTNVRGSESVDQGVYLTRVCNSLGLAIYRDVAKRSPDNVILSPFSMCSMLAVCMKATGGASRKEIRRQLILKLVYQGEVSKVFKNTYRSFKQLDNVSVSSSNIIMADSDFRLNENTVRDFAQSFNGTLIRFNESNFQSSANTLKDIMSSVTDEPYFADYMAVEKSLYLINTLHINARWESKFESSMTLPSSFRLDNGSQVSVPFMEQTSSFRYNLDDTLGVTVLEMPYEGKEFAMYLLLPDEGKDIEEIEGRLKTRTLDKLFRTMKTEVMLRLLLPKFSMSKSLDLKETLSKLGIKQIFDRQNANFNRLVQDDKVFISKAVHESTISVMEEGTVAGSSTMMRADFHSAPSLLIFDRPFIYIIRDSRTGLILYIGRYRAPSTVEDSRGETYTVDG